VSDDLRREKERQFDGFADANGCLRCDLTDESVTFSGAKLSHASPAFIEIVNEFRQQRGWDNGIPPGVLTTSADRQISTEFIDAADGLAFKRLHHKMAVLRIISAQYTSVTANKIYATVKRPIRLPEP
jgi:hypothetical protein